MRKPLRFSGEKMGYDGKSFGGALAMIARLALAVAMLLSAGSLPLLAAEPSKVDPKIHKLCIDAKDYLGCVQAQQGLRPAALQPQVVIDGGVLPTGNSCPSGYAYTLAGYCRSFGCQTVYGFNALGGHDSGLGGKAWKCPSGFIVRVLRWGESTVRAATDPSCPPGPPEEGWESTCQMRDYKK